MAKTPEGQQLAHLFLHPVEYYYQGKLPDDYVSKIEKAMDIGTLTVMWPSYFRGPFPPNIL